MSERSTEQTSAGQDNLVGTILADRYRIDQLIGKGGMGSVYRAEHVHMRKTVAIKVLHRQMTAMDEAVKRFEREAVAAGRIDHPNVALATDFGLHDGSFYMVLEFVRGKSLRVVLREQGAMRVDRALLIARQIAAALQAAHAGGIVHRDLKPDNIMLIDRGETSDFVKVLDFGIAKVTSSEATAGTQLTQFGSVFGTPQYMAPEQAAGQEVDHRADIYALGLILHEMLGGKPTFDSPELVVLLTLQMTEPPPELPPHVPPEVSSLIRSMLDKQPSQRPQSASEAVSSIDALLSRWSIYPAGAPSAPVVVAESPGAPAVSARAPTGPAFPGLRAVFARLRAKLGRDRKPASLRERVTAFITSLPGKKRQTAWQRMLALGSLKIKNRVPVWTVVAAVLALVVVVVAFKRPSAGLNPKEVIQKAKGGSDEKKGSTSEEKSEAKGDGDESAEDDLSNLDPDLRRVISAASRGSQDALYALELRDEKQRTKVEWLAIARGRLKRRDVEKSLEAYERAIEMDPGAASDGAMLGGLRYFAEKESSSESVLEFAADKLGAEGADLLFHVWSTTSRKTAATEMAKRLLGSSKVREHMSEPLRIAMDLREAQTCDDFAKLMPRAEKVADFRSVPRLKELTKTRGCGTDNAEDCFPCLRGDSKLDDTITQAQMRHAPMFGRRRWR